MTEYCQACGLNVIVCYADVDILFTSNDPANRRSISLNTIYLCDSCREKLERIIYVFANGEADA